MDRGVAVVSGAGRGIGKAIARVLASRGFGVAAIDIDRTSVETLCAQIEAEGGEARSFIVDLAQPDSIMASVTPIAEWGEVRALVNNAGILSTAQLEDITVEEWDRVFSINVRAAVLLSQALIPQMVASGGGSVVNISSLAARMGAQSAGLAYTASKSALVGVTMRLARHYAASGVTVNAIAPGPADTEMVQGFTDDQRKALQASIPIGRLIDPQSIAETAAFLVSEPARFITGAVIDVNGGMWMGA